MNAEDDATAAAVMARQPSLGFRRPIMKRPAWEGPFDVFALKRAAKILMDDAYSFASAGMGLRNALAIRRLARRIQEEAKHLEAMLKGRNHG